MKRILELVLQWILRWVPMLLGLAWIIFPDPIVGHIDDILVAGLEITTIIKQTINKFQSAT